MILDIEFETPCGSIIKVDLRVKNDGAKVTIQDAEIVSVGKINLIINLLNRYSCLALQNICAVVLLF